MRMACSEKQLLVSNHALLMMHLIRLCRLWLLLLVLSPFQLNALDEERMVVLTFDDAVKSHRTFVAPYLKELGFGATFFVSVSTLSNSGIEVIKLPYK